MGKCNYCTLQEMKSRAEKRGATVIVRVQPPGEEMDGWTSARYSGEKRPSAWFLELTDHCVC